MPGGGESEKIKFPLLHYFINIYVATMIKLLSQRKLTTVQTQNSVITLTPRKQLPHNSWRVYKREKRNSSFLPNPRRHSKTGLAGQGHSGVHRGSSRRPARRAPHGCAAAHTPTNCARTGAGLPSQPLPRQLGGLPRR